MSIDRLSLEREIVWAACNNGDQFERYSRELPVEFFHDDLCAEAITAMQQMLDDGTEINLVNVGNAIGQRIAMPQSFLSGEADLRVASKRLTELVIMEHKADLVGRLMDEDDPFAAMHEIERVTNRMSSIISLHSRTPKSATLKKWIEQQEENRSGRVMRVPTGFHTLDAWCHGGLKLGNMSFLGGGPGVGKTSFMLKMGMGAAARGHKTVFLEGEMPMDEIYARMMGQQYRLPVSEVEDGKHIERAITDFSSLMQFVEFEVNATYERNVAALMANVRAAVADGAELIIIDYLQVFVEKGGRVPSEEFTKIKALSEMLRKVTLMNRVHIVAASSLNRIMAGTGKVTIDSFYGGAQLGHDCNTAIILTETEDQAGVVEGFRSVDCGIVKNRGGRVGTFQIDYELATQNMVEKSDAAIDIRPDNRYNKADDQPF